MEIYEKGAFRVKPIEQGGAFPNAHDRVSNLCPNTGYQELDELHSAARLEMPLISVTSNLRKNRTKTHDLKCKLTLALAVVRLRVLAY